METTESLFNRRFIAFFALLLTTFASFYLWEVTFQPIPKENTRFVDTIVGFIIGTVMSAPIAFFFGSSKSSQNKDEHSQELTTQLAAAVASSAPVTEATPPTALANPDKETT